MVERDFVHAFAEVNDLAQILTSTEFGKVCQCLLAISFKKIGYSVSHFQFVGRPDFVVESASENLAVEAKSSLARSIVIKKEDISGIVGLGHTPVVAVLTYPELSTRWLIIESTELSPRTYPKSELAAISDRKMEIEVSGAFQTILPRCRQKSCQGASQLVDLIR